VAIWLFLNNLAPLACVAEEGSGPKLTAIDTALSGNGAPNDSGDTSVVDSASEDSDTEDSDAEDSASEDTAEDSGTSPIEEGLPFDQLSYKATHNSYSGGARGSMLEQLQAGVRFLELDIHDNSFSSIGEYTLGHSEEGLEVDLGGGNPVTYNLSDWLGIVADWSDGNPGHVPVTIALDIKDDLTDNPDQSSGNLGALNVAIEAALGDKLLPSEELGSGWPGVGTLRDKVMVVLSGHAGSRKLYKRDRGNNPAIAMNDSGQVISVHDSGSGTLWYWTGQLESDGTVSWKHHGLYDTGQDPAIALNNDGWFVEVHQSHVHATLWSHVGYLTSDLEPVFFSSNQYDDGVSPTIGFLDLDGTSLREIHQSNSTGLAWDWEVDLDLLSNSLDWGSNTQTSDALHLKTRSESAAGYVQITTGTSGNAGSDTLLYSASGAYSARIRYAQLAHVELQAGDAGELEDSETRFCASGHGTAQQAHDWRQAGCIARIWEFSEDDISPDLLPPSFPATDEPHSPWYSDYCEGIGTEE
jgi:hypothetical protein